MKVGIITGSLRQERVTNHISAAVVEHAKGMDGVEVVEIDLKQYDLPHFNEAISPKYNPDRTATGVVKEWLDTLASVDALVIVSPEYNRSIPGSLKNAFDYIAYEISHKPVALVTHGSFSGAFSHDHLRTIVPELGGVTIPRFLAVPYGSFDSEGGFSGDREGFDSQAKALLEQLQQYSDALIDLR